jgi:hypothetical protein
MIIVIITAIRIRLRTDFKRLSDFVLMFVLFYFRYVKMKFSTNSLHDLLD